MAMTKWNLTDNRLELALKMFGMQHTLASVAMALDVSRRVLADRLVDRGVVVDDVRNAARLNVRAGMMSDIMMIEDPAKRFQARAAFLTMYPPIDDVDDVEGDVVDVDIVGLIKAELDG